MLLSQPKRQEMVELALKEQAPQTYKELQQAGTLQTWSASLEEEMYQSYLDAYSLAKTKILASKLTSEAVIQELYSADRQVWEQARAEWLEFSDPMQETSDSL